MAQMKLREGRNFLAEDNGIKTYAQVKGGQVVGYSSTDASGHSLSGRLEKRVTKCQWCVTDSKGRTTCQPVQCPKDPLPPPPKSQY